MLVVRRFLVAVLLAVILLLVPLACMVVPRAMPLTLRAYLAVMILTFELIGVIAAVRTRRR